MEFHQFVTIRLQSLNARPRMWGSNETVEAMALQLLEVEIRHYKPEAFEESPRLLTDAYTQELSRRYGSGVLPLYARTPDRFEHEPKVRDFDQELFDICHKVRMDLRAKLALNLPAGLPEIVEFQKYLQRHFPEARLKLSNPLRPEDVWTLDAVHKETWIVVTWQAPSAYGISKVTEETGYGEGPEHSFTDYWGAMAVAISLLKDPSV
jgi:hypothetical protein